MKALLARLFRNNHRLHKDTVIEYRLGKLTLVQKL